MGEPIKNVFNRELIQNLADHLNSTCPDFAKSKFIKRAQQGLETLEFKARCNHIADALLEFLPKNFSQLCTGIEQALHADDSAPLSQLKLSAEGLRGWGILPLAECIAVRGEEHFELAMQTLALLSCRFTAEFAVRKLINREPKRALNIIAQWSRSPNFHIRRLASEGSRPRLPWAEQIPVWIENPSPLLPILATMKNDPSDYVRKSVANHLNDISKDHPQLVLTHLSRWQQGCSVATQRLIKHACRTLIKRGDPLALQLVGCLPVVMTEATLTLNPTVVQRGETIKLHFCGLKLSGKGKQFEVDYLLHFVKKSGGIGKKVFKWKNFPVPESGQIMLTKTHSFKPITTRTYYPGRHKIEVQINGKIVAAGEFDLV